MIAKRSVEMNVHYIAFMFYAYNVEIYRKKSHILKKKSHLF